MPLARVGNDHHGLTTEGGDASTVQLTRYLLLQNRRSGGIGNAMTVIGKRVRWWIMQSGVRTVSR
ncbi:hypothetical protein ABB29_10950 [Pseudoxanthomonas dokdonensis]|uniref:Uncharacterized protein n=1 Tax=Pseudoxanthomonas dokdonensis TaxID=344882 RepID=A0A0R0CTB4_9GAMM|nr:hypothetical protein ABB29_10950 [Pseudoxanthomonas dokdonensis]